MAETHKTTQHPRFVCPGCDTDLTEVALCLADQWAPSAATQVVAWCNVCKVDVTFNLTWTLQADAGTTPPPGSWAHFWLVQTWGWHIRLTGVTPEPLTRDALVVINQPRPADYRMAQVWPRLLAHYLQMDTTEVLALGVDYGE